MYRNMNERPNEGDSVIVAVKVILEASTIQDVAVVHEGYIMGDYQDEKFINNYDGKDIEETAEDSEGKIECLGWFKIPSFEEE